MNPNGLVIIGVGVLVVVQVFFGGALQRLMIIPTEAKPKAS